MKTLLLALKQSLRLDPYVSDVWCNLGLAYFGLEDFPALKGVSSCHCFNASHAAKPYKLG